MDLCMTTSPIYLTEADVCRLAEESGRHADLVLTLAFTGLRWGEAIGLRVADVEFLRRRLTVSENAVQIGVVSARREADRGYHLDRRIAEGPGERRLGTDQEGEIGRRVACGQTGHDRRERRLLTAILR